MPISMPKKGFTLTPKFFGVTLPGKGGFTPHLSKIGAKHQSRKKSLKGAGFTLIEILIVIAIVAILVTTVMVSYRDFEKKTELETTAQAIKATLRLAQTKTLSSEDASQYGVRFESNKYTLFKGSVYNSAEPDNKEYNLANRLEINSIVLAGGGSDVIFERVTGLTAQDGTVGLRIIIEPAKTQTLIIRSSGQIELQFSGTGCCDTGRVTDTRHIHLDLGWSIQSSVTLTLSFTDTPVVSQDVIMADYFDAILTEFDWSGIIDVNGQAQTLRIHTHSLDAFSTVLCIHRNKDNNTKPLQVLIDSQDIVSYDADGSITVGPFGGIEEIQ